MANSTFYKSIAKKANKLIKKFGNICTIKAEQISTNLTTGNQITRVVFEKEVEYVAKVIKDFLIQDRFYESSEVSIVIPGKSFDYIDKYKYTVKLENVRYEIIRHRSVTPGGYEVLIELALRRSGTGDKNG